MQFIQNRIKDNYVGQEERNRGFAKLKGSVIGADPASCTCICQYTNQYGDRLTETAMKVQTNSPDSWFPKAGDSVIIEVYNDKPLITGRWATDYSKEIYKESTLSSDIFPNQANQDDGGKMT